MQHLDCIISYGDRRKNVDIGPKQLSSYLSCMPQTGGFKLVIGLSPGYGACPHIPDIPLILHLCCVPAAPTGGGGGVFCALLEIVTKGCEWLQGTALRCPALTFSSSPLFNSPTSGLTRTDRLPIHPLWVPHSPSSSPLHPLCSPLNPGATQIRSQNEPQEVHDQLLTVSSLQRLSSQKQEKAQ